MHADRVEPIAFLGGGNMARALAAGLLRQGWPAGQLRVCERLEPTRAALAHDLAVQVTADSAAALEDAALVVLAVKPQDAAVALAALHPPCYAPGAVLLSIAAGLTVAGMARLAPPGLTIVRAMPNRPALLGAGVTALYAAPEVPQAARQRAESIMHAVGRCVWLDTEAHIDVATALSGSGPAYFFLLAEQMALAGEALGLPAATAALLASETLHGAGLLAHEATARGGGVADERRAVTSPGGTTEAALAVLGKADLAQLIARAVKAAAARSAELSANLTEGPWPR